MNKKRWRHPSVPLTVLALKLSEEAAEVGTEITDAIMNTDEVNIKRINEELDHVEFIASVLRERVRTPR